MYIVYLNSKTHTDGETELSFRLIPSLTKSHTKPRTETVREEVILAKEGISLKDNSVSPRTYFIIAGILSLICNHSHLYI